jgi:hypothetical protein
MLRRAVMDTAERDHKFIARFATKRARLTVVALKVEDVASNGKDLVG